MVAKPDTCPEGRIVSGFFVRFRDSKCLLTLQKGTNVAAKYLNFFKFSIDNNKKMCYNIRVAGGIPANIVSPLRFAT